MAEKGHQIQGSANTGEVGESNKRRDLNRIVVVVVGFECQIVRIGGRIMEDGVGVGGNVLERPPTELDAASRFF